MKLSASGLCAFLSGALLLACALGEVAAGLRCASLGSAVQAHFQPGARPGGGGAFYSGVLLGAGQALLGAALPLRGRRNLFLLGVVVLLLGVLAAFSGAVLNGDAAVLAERKLSRYCDPPGLMEALACARLREYRRSLLLSALLCALECLFGILHLGAVRGFKAAQISRIRRGAVESVCAPTPAPSQSVSYINSGDVALLDETRAEGGRGGHPSIELPGYWTTDPELNRNFPFSCRVSCELSPDHDIFVPEEERET